jgi:hypothetical protein
MQVSLRTAAGACAAINVAGALVSMWEDVPGEMFGRRIPGPVRRHLVLGLGSGSSAPWPMVVVAIAAALLARDRPCAVWPGRACVAVGTGTIAGVLVEPVTWGRRGGRPWLPLLNWTCLVVGLLLVLAGLQAVERARQRDCRPGRR